MSEGIMLPVMGVNHAERLKKLIAAQPYRMHGAVITLEGKEINMPSLYASIRNAYNGVIGNLRDMGAISRDFSIADDISWVAFPFYVPNLSSVTVVDLIVGMKGGMLYVEIFFQYKGASAMCYTSGIDVGVASTMPQEPKPEIQPGMQTAPQDPTKPL